METRSLGNDGLQVKPLALGTNVFGWTINEETSFEILDNYVDAGFSLIDTANSYSSWVPGNKGGESETIIGNWLKKTNNRSKMVIATKVGSEINGRKSLKKTAIIEEAEASLKRLQTDYIDLYQTHFPDTTTPEEETLAAYDQLIKQGKVRTIGTSNYNADQLTNALQLSKTKNLPQYQTLQPHYNLYTRADFEKELQPICLENNIGVLPYFSLASGFLTGKYRSEADLGKSARGGGVSKYLNERGFKILKALDTVAAEYNATPGIIAIAWLLTRPTIIAPIASATNTKQLEDLIKATHINLNNQAVKLLDIASAE